MINDIERGAAWTRGVIGLNVKELHLCGEDDPDLLEQLLKLLKSL